MTDTTRLAPSVRELPLEPGGEVQVILTSSSVRIRAVDGDRVSVRTRDGADIDDEIVIDHAPGRVLIRDAERGLRIGPLRLRASGASDLDIDIPRTARLSCKTLSGDVDAEGVGGDGRWATASGDLRLVVRDGHHTVDTMSGDLSLEASAAVSVRARAVSGDLRIRAPRIDALDASTTSGDVRIEADLDAGSGHRITSVSGDVEVVSASPVRVETQTIAGEVLASGTYAAGGGRGRRTLVAGDGSVPLSIHTTSGDIQLRDRDHSLARPLDEPGLADPIPEPPVAPDQPAPPVALESPYVVAEAEAAPNLVRGAWAGGEGSVDRREAARLDILRALERGELDIDAASHRLEQLEEAGPRYFRGWC